MDWDVLTKRAEMSNMDGTDPNRILNETRAIDATLAQLKQEQEKLRQMQSVYLNAVQDKQTAASLKAVTDGNEELMRQFRQLVARTKRMKQDKESGNPRNSPQVGRVDRAVKQALNDFQKLDSEFRKGAQERTRRDYLIVRPDASEAEIREAIQDPDQQVFSQALMRSDRRGDARETLDNVRARHAAIAKIEADMIKLAEMFQDLDALVIQQEAPVTEIERRGEEVTDHVTKANVELDGAVKKARAARKKKWICLGIAGKSSSFRMLFPRGVIPLSVSCFVPCLNLWDV